MTHCDQQNSGESSNVNYVLQEEYDPTPQYGYDPASQFEQLCFESIDFQSPVDAISRDRDARDELFAHLDIQIPDRPGQHTLKTKVGTGAQGNILPIRIFRRMFPRLLDSSGFPKPGSTTPRHTRLMAYNGTDIPQYGSITLQCKYENSVWIKTEFFIAESDGPAIVGLPSSRALSLISINCSIQQEPLQQPASSLRVHYYRNSVKNFRGEKMVPPIVMVKPVPSESELPMQYINLNNVHSSQVHDSKTCSSKSSSVV